MSRLGSVRAYVPATLQLLAEWHAAGVVPADADRLVAPGEDEESEYAALMGAADASQELPGGAGRRVVVVLEVPDTSDTSATAATPVSWWDVAAVHADPVERPPGADPDDDLAWYATQEVPHLLA